MLFIDNEDPEKKLLSIDLFAKESKRVAIEFQHNLLSRAELMSYSNTPTATTINFRNQKRSIFSTDTSPVKFCFEKKSIINNYLIFNYNIIFYLIKLIVIK